MTISGPQKIIYLTLGILFLALGVVGLIIPIVPGILFLLVALYLLSRGSRRVGKMIKTHPDLNRLQSKMAQMNTLNGFERVQVATLMAINATVSALHKAYLGIRGLVVRVGTR